MVEHMDIFQRKMIEFFRLFDRRKRLRDGEDPEGEVGGLVQLLYLVQRKGEGEIWDLPLEPTIVDLPISERIWAFIPLLYKMTNITI